MPLDKNEDLKPRTKSTDNVKVIEMRKERSRNAARSRRGKENAQFDELAKLLPLPAAITSQLDKASIIRLTISYLSMKEFSGAVPRRLQLADGSEIALSPSESNADASSPISGTGREVVPYKKPLSIPKLLEETGSQLLQALDGFLVVLSVEGKILYVSETVSINLGLSQVELTGNSIFNYIHAEDHTDLIEQLSEASLADPATESQFQDTQGLFQCQQSQHSNPLFNQGEEIRPPKFLINEPRSFFVRMKCTLVRRGGSYAKSAGFKVVHCVGRIKSYASDSPRKAFVLLAQPVPTMNINELPLECNMFVSRVNMDLKIVYCEGRIHRFMDYLAKDIVGISAYDFYHAGDVALIQGHHAKFLSKGQVWTKYYRWMNKNGGWVWMQTKASLIPHPSNASLKQMLCLNYILSDVEHRSVVLGMAQLKDKPELQSASNILTEVPCQTDNSGDLNDALIDDQVMVFPKWQATSDKLVPPQTVLDQMALQRTGYTQQFNEAFTDWSNQKSQDRASSQSEENPDQDIDDKDLQDIAEIISAEVTPFDYSLFDFVVSGTNSSIMDMPPSYLGPIGAYIEEIPETTTVPSTSSVIPKVESISMRQDSGSAMSCSQTGTSVQEGVPRKRPAASSYTYVESAADIPSKAPRLSHMQTIAAANSSKIISQSSSHSPYHAWNPSQMPGQNTPATSSTIPKESFYQGISQNVGGRVSDRPAASSSQNKTKILATRKPKSLLEQLVMMPNSGNDEDILNDDLMFELVEELLEKSSDDNMMGSVESVQGFDSGFGSGNVPRQQIKQEVVTPTSTEQLFTDCFQNMPKTEQHFAAAAPYQGNTSSESVKQSSNNLYQASSRRPNSLGTQNNNVQGHDTSLKAFLDRSSPSLRPSVPQQQWQPQQPQHSWQPQHPQKQQLQQSLQQYQQQMPQVSTQRTTTQIFPQQNLQELQQKQQPLPQYGFLHPQQQQQRPLATQPLSEQDRLLRELSDLIQTNNSMQTSFANQQTVRISSAPLPELGSGLDDELNSVPVDQQTLTNQNFNGTVPGTGERNRNFTGMM